MTRTVARLGAVAAAALLAVSAAPAFAQDADMASIQAQIDQMKADYEARIAALEARVVAAEANRGAAPADAASAQAANDADAPATAADQPVEVATAEEAAADEPVASALPAGNALNPGISVVLNGNYFAASRDPSLARIPGYELGEEAGLPDRGFSLGESEIALAANIDPYFYGQLNVSFNGQGEAEVEEAFIRTTALPGGLTAKVGRFFSGVGYLNERHAHSWMFSDMPLPYRAFLGNQYGDDGVQLRWIAPTDIYVEFGAEAFRGDSFPAGNGSNRGAGTWAAYVHTGSDINDSWSWLAGLSWLHAESDARETEDPVFGIDSFTGGNDVGILSAVAKWAPNGNPIQRNFSFSAEYFFGGEKGLFNGVPVDLDRSGWYAQGAYQFMPRWTIGARYSRLNNDDPGPLLLGTSLDPMGVDPWNASALIEYDTSEFTRLRLQYTRDESGLEPSDQILLQFTATYGPHDAHRY